MTAWSETMPVTSPGCAFLLFRRYWELFAPYLTPDLAGERGGARMSHERPRSLDGRPCASCDRGQLARMGLPLLVR